MGFKREYCQNYDESSSEDNFEDFFEENCSNCSGSIISTVSEESGYPEEIEIIKQALLNAPPSGEYSTGGEASMLPTMLGLWIKDFGCVSLPLNAIQADELIKKCTQAPYGHNFNTLINTEVRDSYQLDPSSLEIKNPDWPSKLQELVDKVCIELGCQGKAEAKLYKLLLYKSGGHFKKHRDTEKDEKMFATLILQLPSIHTGGDLIVYNPDKTTFKHDFGKLTNKSAYEIHYAAHYADAEHEITEITSGYRLALVYSICWINGNGICNYNTDDFGLHKALDMQKNKNNLIGILLDHRYTPRSFQQNGIRALKGIDNDRYNMLRCANQKLNDEEKFDFNLVHACLTIESYDVSGNYYSYRNRYYDRKFDGSDYEWEENERSSEIRQWYDSEGNLKADLNRVSFSSSFFDYVIDIDRARVLVDYDYRLEKTFGNDDVQEEIDGYTGNSSLNRTIVYNKYLMILIPKTYQFELYCKANLSFAIEYLGNSYNSMSIESLAEKLKMCLMQLSMTKMIFNSSLEAIFQLLPITNDIGLVKLFLSKLTRIGDNNLLKGVVKLVQTFGWNELEDSLSSFLDYHDNTITICKLILIEIEERELSLKCCQKYLFPIFNDVNHFMELDEDDSTIKYFFTILDTILMFEKPDFENYLNKLVEIFKQKKILLHKLKTCAELICRNFKLYKNSPSVISIVRMRVNCLENLIQPSLEFNWRMNGNIAGHPQFENFLRSDLTKMNYNGVINGVGSARRFISLYSGLKKDYSVYMNYSRTGSRVVVQITKTKEYFDSKVENLNLMKAELEILRKLMEYV